MQFQVKGARTWAKEVVRRFDHARGIFSKKLFSLAVPGHIELESDFVYDAARGKDRGRQAPDGKYYSKSYHIEPADLPNSIKNAIRGYDAVLRMYLGDDYRIQGANVWRNWSIPAELRGTDLFSQVWHYDRVIDFRNIQLFVLISDVGPDDGPFEYATSQDEYRVLPQVLARTEQVLDIPSTKLIGKRGDTLLFTTGSTPHRAGIPAEGRTRDMCSVEFFPAYANVGVAAKEVLRS